MKRIFLLVPVFVLGVGVGLALPGRDSPGRRRTFEARRPTAVAMARETEGVSSSSATEDARPHGKSISEPTELVGRLRSWITGEQWGPIQEASEGSAGARDLPGLLGLIDLLPVRGARQREIVLETVITLMVSIPGREAAAALLELLVRPGLLGPDQQALVMDELAARGFAESTSIIEGKLRDSDEFVRIKAGAALVILDPDRYLFAFLSVIRADGPTSPELARSLAQAASSGADLTRALPALRERYSRCAGWPDRKPLLMTAYHMTRKQASADAREWLIQECRSLLRAPDPDVFDEDRLWCERVLDALLEDADR